MRVEGFKEAKHIRHELRVEASLQLVICSVWVDLEDLGHIAEGFSSGLSSCDGAGGFVLTNEHSHWDSLVSREIKCPGFLLWRVRTPVGLRVGLEDTFPGILSNVVQGLGGNILDAVTPSHVLEITKCSSSNESRKLWKGLVPSWSSEFKDIQMISNSEQLFSHPAGRSITEDCAWRDKGEVLCSVGEPFVVLVHSSEELKGSR